MFKFIRLLPILIGFLGAFFLAALNIISWGMLIFLSEDLRVTLRGQLNELGALHSKGVFPPELMLNGGILGIMMLLINYLIAPFVVGWFVRIFARGSERQHGRLLSGVFFVFWSLGAMLSRPAEPMLPGMIQGVWLAIVLYGISAVSLYFGSTWKVDCPTNRDGASTSSVSY